VISTAGKPVPGVFCAGEMMGGLFYENYPGGVDLLRELCLVGKLEFLQRRCVELRPRSSAAASKDTLDVLTKREMRIRKREALEIPAELVCSRYLETIEELNNHNNVCIRPIIVAIKIMLPHVRSRGQERPRHNS